MCHYPWGVAQFLKAADTLNLPRVVSIQNPYNLLNRVYEIALAEFTQREGIGLLAYSPLGFGLLSGKYQDGARPASARLTLFDRFTRYDSPEARAATTAYVALAKQLGLTPVQLALGFVNHRPFVASTIIGATSLAQLQQDLDSVAVKLDADALAAVDAIHQRWPNPAP